MFIQFYASLIKNLLVNSFCKLLLETQAAYVSLNAS